MKRRVLFVCLLVLVGCGGQSDDVEAPYHLVFLSDRAGTPRLFQARHGEVGALPFAVRLNGPVFGLRWDASRSSIVVANEREEGSFLVRLPVPTDKAFELWRNPAGDEVPDWAPSGREVVYSAPGEGGLDLYLADEKGGEARVIAGSPGDDKQPRWSPDGKSIAFVSDRTGNQDVFIWHREEDRVENVTDNPAKEGHPTWSPDGKQLLFYRDDDGDADLWLLWLEQDAETETKSEPFNVTRSSGADLAGSWSPDGSWIAFGSDRSGNWEIFVSRADGWDLRQVTHNSGLDSDPIWIPQPLERSEP